MLYDGNTNEDEKLGKIKLEIMEISSRILYAKKQKEKE